MNSKKYIEEAVSTKSSEYDKIYRRCNNDSFMDILHGAIGISTEAGELLDAIKKHIYYGKKLDLINVKEEIGDIFWYTALICSRLNVSFEEIMRTNIEKLKARYPNKFTEDKAINRDIERERSILENEEI